jgi:hypothetical protein
LDDKNFSTDHILVDKKEQRKWCALVVDVKGDGLAMEGTQRFRTTVAVVVHKNILSDLVAIIKQQKGKKV